MTSSVRWWVGIILSGLWGLTARGAAPEGAPVGRLTVDLMVGEWGLKPASRAELLTPGQRPPEPPEVFPESPGPEEWRLFKAPGRYDASATGGAWLTRTFPLPENLAGKVCLLKFDSVVFGHRVYVNGQDCGFALGGFAPTEFDITRAVRPGVNRIHLAVSNADSNPDTMVWPSDAYSSQRGIWGDRGQMIGLWQRARIEIVPAVYVADIYCKPSVTGQTLTVEIEVVNATAEEQSGTLQLAVCEETEHGSHMAGREVKRWPELPFRVGPGERQTLTTGGPWENPRLWWPHDPHLYIARVELKSTGHDIAETRFGFVEYTIDGVHLRINGKKMFMRGGAMTRYNTVILSKAEAREKMLGAIHWMNANALRLHCDPMEQYVLDAADEAGVFLLVQPPNAAGASGESRKEVWASQMDLWLRYIKQSRNRPSVVIWAVCNEGTFWGGGGEAAPALPYLVELAKRIKKLVPTRFVSSSHDTPLYRRGVIDFMDASTGWCAETDNFHPRQCRLWQTYFWNPVQEYKKDKPWIDDEWGHANSIHAAANFVGDKSYIHRDWAPDARNYWQAWGGSVGLWMGMIEHRRQPYFCTVLALGDLYSYCDIESGKYVADPAMMTWCNQSWAAQAIFPREYYGGAWAGETYRRTMIVMNDVFYPASGKIVWSVTDSANTNTVLARGETPLKIPAATHQEVTLEIRLPRLTQPLEGQLNYQWMDKDGTVRFSDSHAFGILPRPSWRKLEPVVLWPEAGSLGKLEKPPVKWQVVPLLPSSTGTVVIVPRGVEVSYDQWRELEAWIQQGGRALVLCDERLPAEFGGTMTRSSRKGAVCAHVRASDHPVVQGLPAASLRYWVGAAGEVFSPPEEKNIPDLFVATTCLKKPLAGTYLTLLDSSLGAVYLGEPDPGLTQSPMLEVRHGKGRAIFCSLLLAEGMTLDIPAAATLFYRALAYLQTPALHVGGTPQPAHLVGVQAPRLRLASDPNSPIHIVNAAHPEGQAYLEQRAAGLRDFVRAGGRVVLHNLNTEQVQRLGEIFDVAFETRFFNTSPPTEQTIAHRLDIVQQDPLLRGISHFELNWNETGHFVSRFLSRQPILKLGLFAKDPRVVNVTRQGAILVLREGKGVLVVDQVAWDPESFVSDYARRRADGYVSALLSNLDVATIPRKRHPDPSAPQPTPRTLMLYHFEPEGTGLASDEGPNGFDLMLNETVEFAEGRVGYGLRLKTPNSAVFPILMGATAGLQKPDMTISFWIKPETDPNAHGVGAGDILAWVRGGAFESRDTAVFMTPQGTIGVGLGGGGFTAGSSRTSIWKKDEWTHVTVTMSASANRFRVYLNGVLDAEWKPAMSYYPYGGFMIGNPGKARQPAFQGIIDELHIVEGEWVPPTEPADQQPAK